MKPRLTVKKKKGGYASIEEAHSKQQSKPVRKSKRTPKRSGKNNAATQVDFKLRQAVEGDGTRKIIDIEADGNCLFRAISDQLYHDFGNNHAEVRHEICDFIAGHKEDFAVFLVLDDADAASAEEEDARDFETYVHNMRQDGDWGGHLELVAAARMYRRNITVFSANLDAYTVEHGSSAKSAGPDLLVSYHDNDHYNSVRCSSGGKPPPPIKTYVVDLYCPKPMAVDGNINNEENVSVGAHDVCNDVDADMTVPEEESGALTTLTSYGSIEVAWKGTTDATAASAFGDCTPQQRPKKGDICPCGSGQRYKKCCYLHEKRVKRRQREHCITTGQSMPKEVKRGDSTEMNGDFRVLKI